MRLEGDSDSIHKPAISTSLLYRFIHCFCGSNKKWILVRFMMIFLPSVIILCCIYGFKSATHKKLNNKVSDFAYSVGDRLFGNDLWLVIEVESNDRGLRTSLGKAIGEHVCSAIKAGQEVGWTPLVVGARSPCCKTYSCRHLHPQDLKEMKLLSTTYFLRKYDFSSAMKVGAFLVAIKRGAVVIFHANPEVYFQAGVTPDSYREQLKYQLKKLTLGVSFGLVKSKEPEGPSYYNPYTHFVYNLEPSSDTSVNRYKICEKDPPEMEKFLDNDGFSMDLSSPSLTLPGRMAAPFDSRNTAFSKKAFWSLLVLPDIKDIRSPRYVNDEAIYVFRSIIAQTILAATGGSTEFSISQVATIKNVYSEILPEDMTELAIALDSWKCTSHSATSCFRDLSIDLWRKGILSESNTHMIDLWIRDLISIGYEDPSTIVNDDDQYYPCIEEDALVGVYFQPSAQAFEKINRTEISINSTKHGNITSLATNHNHALSVVRRLCPSVDRNYLTTSISNKSNKNENLVLIITFSNKQYQNLPIIEVLYRHHFKNILYCGEPDDSINQYREHFSASQGIVFSFIPAFRHPGYECLLGALEMGYNVDGFLVADQKTLINSWNFKGMDSSTIWHGNEVVQRINKENFENLTKVNPNILLSTYGIKRAFEFLEEALLKVGNVSYDRFLHHGVNHQKPHRSENETRFKRSNLEFYGDEVFTDRPVFDEDIPFFTKDSRNSSNEDDQQPTLQVSLFGELEEQDFSSDILINETSFDQDVSELLLDPANFRMVDENENEKSTPKTHLEKNHFFKIDNASKILVDIEHLVNQLNDKLNLWLQAITSPENVNPEDLDFIEDLQCDISTNFEICRVVANFFRTLKSNEKDGFELFYDQLPVYYVPSEFKETMFLMSNLFTRFDVADKMAFPILLRGLSHTSTWKELIYAEIPNGHSTYPSEPEDIFLFADDSSEESNVELRRIESSHYIYPVEIKTVLTNDKLRNIICRNFGA